MSDVSERDVMESVRIILNGLPRRPQSEWLSQVSHAIDLLDGGLLTSGVNKGPLRMIVEEVRTGTKAYSKLACGHKVEVQGGSPGSTRRRCTECRVEALQRLADLESESDSAKVSAPES